MSGGKVFRERNYAGQWVSYCTTARGTSHTINECRIRELVEQKLITGSAPKMAIHKIDYLPTRFGEAVWQNRYKA